MLKVLRAVGDEFEIEDLSDGDKMVVSAEMLVLLLAKNEFEGCKHSRNGVEVWYNGVEPYEIVIEVWKPVILVLNGVLYSPIRYEVSNLGRIRRWYKYGVRVLSPVASARGYLRIGLCCDNGERILYSVHRLVALAFIPTDDYSLVINHKDEVKTNNGAYNLEWCTQAYNAVYGTARERQAKSVSRPVRQYSTDGVLLACFNSTQEAERLVGAVSASISHCCSGYYKIHHSCIWRYVDSDEFFEMNEDARRVAMSKIVRRYVGLIRQYSMDGRFVAEHRSAAKAAASLGDGYYHKRISECCKRQRHDMYNFMWRYETDDEYAKAPENAKAIAEWRQSCNV